jgi:hypothetical protein
MIVLADETLEKFFDVELGYSFKLTEKPAEQQKSLGREIFNNLLATGAKLATTAGVTRPQLLSRSTDTPSELEATIENLETMNLETPTTHQEVVPEEKEDEEEKEEEEANDVIGSDSDELTDDEGELSPDVLEEVDRLLKEYGDDDEN